jgi:hypothetical protein
MVKPFPSAPDLSRVFEAEYLGQSSDDEYTPNNRKAARGLEDEGEDDEQDESAALPRAMASGSVSLFA